MTVAELIARLQTFPGSMRVITDGYEDGYEDIDAPEYRGTIRRRKPQPPSYSGLYELAKRGVTCVFIPRHHRRDKTLGPRVKEERA